MGGGEEGNCEERVLDQLDLNHESIRSAVRMSTAAMRVAVANQTCERG
jgi:hypothetical protein